MSGRDRSPTTHPPTVDPSASDRPASHRSGRLATNDRPPMIRSPTGELLIERFSRIRRFEHTLVVIVFVALVVTGFPQKFDTSPVGHWFLQLFGGLSNARLIHRIAGIVFALHAVIHLTAIVFGGLTGRIRLTLLPVVQDLRDAWGTLRFYFGHRPHPPELPKFDYRQKFEYIGLILGGLVMVSSGMILLFPVFAARYLPSVVIPVAHVAHSNEAMLAFLVLVIWHVYGSIFSPEIFPLDRSILTGYISAEELKERHALEYRRLFPEGEPGGPEDIVSGPRASVPATDSSPRATEAPSGPTSIDDDRPI
ncbi:MAG: cytochrome b/b6 domain-containing protein [Deltaproteobacteria bacterium]|nr:cytochrome b/b6 domain-containing protein [Deltaproteobacteria bacterium]